MKTERKALGGPVGRPAFGRARDLALRRTGGFANLGASSTSMSTSEQFGLAILTGLSITGIYSSVNPSWFTLRAFAADGPNKAEAVAGQWISLGLSTLAAAAIWWVFDSFLAAAVAEAVALALFGIGQYALNAPVAKAPARAAA